MPLSLLQITSTSPLHSSMHYPSPTTFLPKSLFPDFRLEPRTLKRWIFSNNASLGTRTMTTFRTSTTHASLLENPVLWAGRLCIFYALLKAGLAGSPENPLVSGLCLIIPCSMLSDFFFLKFWICRFGFWLYNGSLFVKLIICCIHLSLVYVYTCSIFFMFVLSFEFAHFDLDFLFIGICTFGVGFSI